VNLLVHLLSIRSSVTKMLLLTICRTDYALARDLAAVAGIESKHVYPYIKPFIGRLIEVIKAGSVNLYRATDNLKRATRDVIEMLEEELRKMRGKLTKRKIIERAMQKFRERHGVEMDEDHILVLEIFIDHLLNNSSPYIRVDPGKETLPKVIIRIIKEKHGKIIDEEKVIEILRELELAKIIYIDRRYYKARLDKSMT